MTKQQRAAERKRKQEIRDFLAQPSKRAADHPVRAAATTTCSGCGREIEELEVFPKGRCLECHAAAPETQREAETMTAEKLAAMWGAKH